MDPWRELAGVRGHRMLEMTLDVQRLVGTPECRKVAQLGSRLEGCW